MSANVSALFALLTLSVGAWGHKAAPGLAFTQSQALQKAFPGFKVERLTAFTTLSAQSFLEGVRRFMAV